MKLKSLNLVNAVNAEKNYKKLTYKERNFEFFKSYGILFAFLTKQITKSAIKREKSKLQNSFTKFHVSSFIPA